jgi:hypothetical protein
MKSRDDLISEINGILSAWNPIEVPPEIAQVEYSSYAEPILRIGSDYDRLRAYLAETVSKTMGLGYDDSNEEHRADIETVARKILSLY